MFKETNPFTCQLSHRSAVKDSPIVTFSKIHLAHRALNAISAIAPGQKVRCKTKQKHLESQKLTYYILL